MTQPTQTCSHCGAPYGPSAIEQDFNGNGVYAPTCGCESTVPAWKLRDAEAELDRLRSVLQPRLERELQDILYGEEDE